MTTPKKHEKTPFTPYEVFLVVILTILQFTIILDFMVISPLGAILIPALSITPQQFGWVVSAYAFSAGISGLLAAGFADRFDRKRMLLFFYMGFVVGTLFCGLAPNYHLLLLARTFTGIFGGVMSSISFAIVTDVFAMHMRGRVMGFLQMAFSSSQVLGLPIGLYVAEKLNWHAPFILIVLLAIPIGFVIFFKMRPVDKHLSLRIDRNPFMHIFKTIATPRYLQGFAATILLATGGFMLMPFASTFSVGNLGIKVEELPLLYMATGVAAMIAGPVAGRISDQIGKFKMFFIGSMVVIPATLIQTNLGVTPLWLVMVITAILFSAITARIVGSSALITGVPAPEDRGAFMSLSSAFQQISGGIGSALAGLIVVEGPNGALKHYDTVGYIVVGATLVTVFMMYTIHRMVFFPKGPEAELVKDVL